MKKFLPVFVAALVLMGAGCAGNVKVEDEKPPAPVAQKPDTTQPDTTKPTPKPPVTKPEPEVNPSPLPNLETKIILAAQNNSGESGLVTITSLAPKTSLSPAKIKVVVSVTGAPAGVSQPAHIHFGSCPNPGAVRFTLNPVVNGKSETEINFGFDDLFDAKTKMAVNIHKSATEMSKYLACGNIN